MTGCRSVPAARAGVDRRAPRQADNTSHGRQPEVMTPLSQRPHLLFLHRRLGVCPLDPQSDTGWLLSIHPGCLISPSLSSSCCSVSSKTNTLWVPIVWGYFNVHSFNKHNFTNSFNKTRTQLFYSTTKLRLHVKCTLLFTRYGRWYTWRQRADRNVWVNA